MPLDPRPAMDLLEDLLADIRDCWLLYQEHTDASTAQFADDEDFDDETDGRRRIRRRGPFSVREFASH
jgi:hypothetical protein